VCRRGRHRTQGGLSGARAVGRRWAQPACACSHHAKLPATHRSVGSA
jgi:hypothetical protein